MVLTAWLCAFLIFALAVALLWLAAEPETAPAGRTAPGDPYRAEVEKFRKQVADWDGAR